jgi:hypothetical protein
MSKGSKSQTQTQRIDIPEFLRPLLEQQAGLGQDILSQVQGDFSQSGAGSVVAPFDPLEEQAFGLAEQRALGAGGFIPTAQNELLRTARGEGITLPGFQAQFEAALRQAQPRVSSPFALAGRTGGGLAQVAQTQAAADAFAGLLGQERQNQLQAAQLLPQFGMTDVGILGDIGAQRRGLAQSRLTAPIDLLQSIGGITPLQSTFGQTSRVPFQGGSRALGALGGAAAGAKIGSLVPGIGTGIGAGVGGLIGLLG